MEPIRLATQKWYSGGLRFKCTGCGNCCTGAPGYVWVSREEIRRIANFLERDDQWLPPEILRRVSFKYSLTERSNGDCVFLMPLSNGKRGCRIYPVRPLQCRTWPFWTVNLKSPNTWAQTSESCPGMNNGRQFTFEEIEERRQRKDWG
ncbi:MAG TPA: YkgJ family cysteine cluster protein [Phycisphaerae bacterium]|nr:YkgJ family cysteine cluster protein [Phycisphaerae bacterium]